MQQMIVKQKILINSLHYYEKKPKIIIFVYIYIFAVVFGYYNVKYIIINY